MIVVGDWARRQKRGVPHLVESVVSGDVVTRCGRRMRDEANRDGDLEWVPDYNQERCKVCDR